ncbi:MAG TPA: poly-gamma-glutamate hydrolase family protein [Polyangiaceae bacterium]|nr:poly-gamma-glutamate hydrolase family protein [Polyangiaceae bacterium]
MRRYVGGSSILANNVRSARAGALARLALGAVALSACALEAGEGEAGEGEAGERASAAVQHCSAEAEVSFSATFRPDATMPNDDVGDHDRTDEHCRVGAGRAALVGKQVRARITSTARVALCTVTGTHNLGDGIVTLNPEGALEKLAISADTAGTLSDRVDSCGWVAEALAGYDATPTSAGGIGEFFAAPAGTARAAFTAPHGGGIETGTDLQVKFLDDATGMGLDAWFWAVKGRGTEQHDRWHITSVDLSERSFDGLSHLTSNVATIRQAVSFHGHGGGTCDGTALQDVLVGGGATLAYRAAVANFIALYAAARGQTITTRTDFTSCGGLAGAAATNYVNELSDFGEGLQLEQSLALRNDVARRETVAEAAANYVVSFNNDTVVNLGQTASSAATGRAAVALGAAFAVPAGRAVVSPTDYGSCSSGDTARADWWQRQATGLVRIGGGALTCTSGRLRPGAGFQAWSLPAAAAASQVRVVATAYRAGAVAPALAVRVD